MLKSRKMNELQIFFTFLSLFSSGVQSVKILHLSIPKEVKRGSNEVILDCNFDYNPMEREQLEIKWYFNRSETPFFQWVPHSRSPPQLIGDLFVGHIDLSYASDHDAFKKHRALLIRRPTLDMTGVYACKVSTLHNEEIKRKRMFVFAPPETIEFDGKSSKGQVNVTCEAKRVFPLPRIKLTLGSRELDDSYLSVIPDYSGGKTMNVTLHRLVRHSELTSKSNKFGCEIQIPGTSYMVRDEFIYRFPHSYHRSYSHLSSSSSMPPSQIHGQTHLLIFLCIFHALY